MTPHGQSPIPRKTKKMFKRWHDAWEHVPFDAPVGSRVYYIFKRDMNRKRLFLRWLHRYNRTGPPGGLHGYVPGYNKVKP